MTAEDEVDPSGTGAGTAARLVSMQPVLMCRDVGASVRFYVERLGFAFAFQDRPDDPRYAGVRRDGIELHLQWHDAAAWDPARDRPTYRFVVDEVEALHREFGQRGVAAMTEVMDTAWATREFHVQDPDRNGLQFYRGRQAARSTSTSAAGPSPST